MEPIGEILLEVVIFIGVIIAIRWNAHGRDFAIRGWTRSSLPLLVLAITVGASGVLFATGLSVVLGLLLWVPIIQALRSRFPTEDPLLSLDSDAWIWPGAMIALGLIVLVAQVVDAFSGEREAVANAFAIASFVIFVAITMRRRQGLFERGVTDFITFTPWEQFESFAFRPFERVAMVELRRRRFSVWGRKVLLMVPIAEADRARTVLAERIPLAA